MDWVLPADEIIAIVEMMAAQERKAAASKAASRVNGSSKRPNRGHNGIASRLREFAFHFMHAF